MPIENEETIDNMEIEEDEILSIHLSSAAQRTAITIEEYIETRMLSGASSEVVVQELMEDLRTGGRIFGEFRNTLKATAHGNIRRIADIGNYTENGIKSTYSWVTVQNPNVCPDCKPRHGRKEDLATWEKLGTPRSGWSICRQLCRCFLASSEGPAMPAEPVKRQRKRK